MHGVIPHAVVSQVDWVVFHFAASLENLRRLLSHYFFNGRFPTQRKGHFDLFTEVLLCCDDILFFLGQAPFRLDCLGWTTLFQDTVNFRNKSCWIKNWFWNRKSSSISQQNYNCDLNSSSLSVPALADLRSVGALYLQLEALLLKHSGVSFLFCHFLFIFYHSFLIIY